jgi:hypothetical protein
VPSWTHQDSDAAPALAKADERRLHLSLEVIDSLYDVAGTVKPMWFVPDIVLVEDVRLTGGGYISSLDSSDRRCR